MMKRLSKKFSAVLLLLEGIITLGAKKGSLLYTKTGRLVAGIG